MCQNCTLLWGRGKIVYKFGKVPNLCAQFWHFARFVRGPLLNNYNLPPHGINLPLQAVTEVLPNFEKIYLLSVCMNNHYNPYLYCLVLIQIQIIQAKFCSKKARMPNWFTSILLIYKWWRRHLFLWFVYRQSHYLPIAPSLHSFKWNLLFSH